MKESKNTARAAGERDFSGPIADRSRAAAARTRRVPSRAAHAHAVACAAVAGLVRPYGFRL